MPSIKRNDEVKCDQHQVKKTMNKAENVPIATLSGIASLTEITPELPLPASTCTKDIQLFPSDDDATESIKLVEDASHSQQQIQSFEKLLCSVNNAYLDFKNSIHNRPSVFTDVPHLPPIIQQVTRNRPDVFQPHFDTYHGSPLKTNNVSALAYSPNQRNTFIMHQQQQQQQQQQPQASPLMQGSQSLFSSNSLDTTKPPTNHQPVNNKSRHNSIVSDEAPPFSPLTINPDDVLRSITESQPISNEDIQNSIHMQDDNEQKSIKVNGQCTNENYTDLNEFVPAEIVSQNVLKEVEIRLRKKRKKKHKQKRERIDIDENNELSNKKFSPNNEIDDEKLDLRIPKLIVRKVKRIQNDNEIEILEIARTDKDKQTFQTNEILIQHEPILDVKEEPPFEILSVNIEQPNDMPAEEKAGNLPLKEPEVSLVVEAKQIDSPAVVEMQIDTSTVGELKQIDTPAVCELKQIETPAVVIEDVKKEQNCTSIEKESIPSTPAKKSKRIVSPSVVVDKLQNDIIAKSLNIKDKRESPVISAEVAIQKKKRLHHETSSVSSEEQTLEQVRKRKKAQTRESGDEEKESEPATKSSEGSVKQTPRRSRNTRSNHKESSDEEKEATKSSEGSGKPLQRRSRNARSNHKESSDEEKEGKQLRRRRSTRSIQKDSSDEDNEPLKKRSEGSGKPQQRRRSARSMPKESSDEDNEPLRKRSEGPSKQPQRSSRSGRSHHKESTDEEKEATKSSEGSGKQKQRSSRSARSNRKESSDEEKEVTPKSAGSGKQKRTRNGQANHKVIEITSDDEKEATKSSEGSGKQKQRSSKTARYDQKESSDEEKEATKSSGGSGKQKQKSSKNAQNNLKESSDEEKEATKSSEGCVKEKQKSSKTARHDQKESSDEEKEATKSSEGSGKQKQKSSKTAQHDQKESSDEEKEATKTSEGSGKQIQRGVRNGVKESSDEDKESEPEPARPSRSRPGSSRVKSPGDSDYEYDPAQGCSSGSNVRRGRKKPVNYKEAKSASEEGDSEDSGKPVKARKRKTASRRKASSASDEDFNPAEETRSSRRGGRERRSNRMRTPSPADADRGDWTTPALDPYWDEESDDNNNEEMENLNKEIAAQGAKTEVKKFMFIMEKILEHELELEADGNLDINEDIEIPPESLISRHLISALCTEVAKMKSSGKLSEMPADQLVRIIAIMDRHVKDTMHVIPTQDLEEGEEGRRWFAIQIERVVRSAEAAAIILHITTSPDMPKQVFLEEAIERVASLCHFHLENTIFPAFDPIYKVAGDGDCYSKKARRYRSSGAKSKSVHKVYNKFCEVVSLLAHLLSQESLTDSIILKMSQIGISPFFVEHVSILQLEALKVSRAIFRNYVKHRDLILEDILASLSRLPSTKRNLRTYRLHGNEVIQMFTALVLQLIQCTVQIPTSKEISDDDSQGENSVDKDVLIVKSYEDALRAARNFLAVFLKKCSSSSRDENDFRPLFENFLHDLFTTANVPEWPAAEVLLTQLGHLFVVTFSNTKLEMNLRTTSLDYLAQIATHLRKAALKSEGEAEKEKLKSIVEKLINNSKDAEEVPVTDDMNVYDEKLRKALLLFLLSSSDSDPSFKYAREFYLGQWIRDVQMEIEKSIIAPMMSIPGAAGKKGKEAEERSRKKSDVVSEKLLVLQEKKGFYHTLIDDITVSILKSNQTLNYDSACTTIDHLASSRSFSQSFNLYMQQIFKMLSEHAIALRTKAVKALTMIVSVDPNILARDDVQASVHGRLLDPSTNVREAAVDLIGQFVLKCPNLIKQYYEMIIARILDTGVSVRKRVIKILRDICVEHPDFEKIPEICAKMIRRIEDESGIKKLVTEVFRTMWFQPVKEASKGGDQLYQKAVNITKVISMCKDTGFDWLESLLGNLFDTTESQTVTNIAISACQQLVDCLFTRLLKPELKSETNTVVSCLITLYLFCKAYPNLLINHAATLQPYLSSKIETPTDSLIIQHVSKILEIVVPLMEHPSPKFLADLEEDSMKLMLKQSQNVVQSCASCLASIINNVTHNYKFIVDGFSQFYRFLIYYKREHIKDSNNPALKPKRPSLLRALFTIGLFCRHFDLDTHVPEEGESAEEKFDKDKPRSEQVFDLCMYFTDFADELITLKAILAIGFIGVRYPKLLLKDACRNLYQEILSPLSTSTNAKFTVLKSLQNHLIEEELRLQQAEKGPGSKSKKKMEKGAIEKEDIKEMGDALSGTTSEIIQVLLKDIMKGFFHGEKQVRISALQVVAIILRQGLIHPAQCIPYLVAISTDNERLSQVKAEQCLNDLDSRYQGFIHMKAFQGVKMSYDIQFVIQKSDGGYLCAYRESENKIALINHVYGLIRSNKQYRRPFLLSMLKQADDSKASSDLKYYIAENLAYIGYSTHEEPLFVLYHIDKSASVSGANILQKFKELFHPPSKMENGNGKEDSDSSDDEEEDESQLEDCKVNEEDLKKIVKQSFGCLLMLELKKYLKSIYGFTDSKCQKYSPLEPTKLYERPLNRKCDLDFVSEYKDFMFSPVEYEKAVKYYLQFKKMMMSLDKEQDDSDSDLDEKTDTKKKETSDATPATTSAAATTITNGDDTPSETPTRVTRSREPTASVPAKAAAAPMTSPTRSSRRQQQESTKESTKTTHSNTPGSDIKWTIELKMRLVEMARDCKLQSSRGFGLRLKKRWSEELPEWDWMTPDALKEHAEKFESDGVIDKRDSRRSSRRSTR